MLTRLVSICVNVLWFVYTSMLTAVYHAGSSASVMVQQPTERPLSAAPVEPATPDSASEYLTWLPATCSAVSLRLFALDSAIIYRPGDQPGRETLQVTLPPCHHP